MRQRPLDVLPPHLSVEADGGVDLLHHRCRTSREATAPLRVRRHVPVVRLAQRRPATVPLITRRAMFAVAGTLAAGLTARKPYAGELHDLATALERTDPPVAAPDIV